VARPYGLAAFLCCDTTPDEKEGGDIFDSSLGAAIKYCPQSKLEEEIP